MYATVNDVEIFHTSAGEGLPCLVPSLAGTPIYERTFASPALLARLRLIFAELRANRTAVGDVAALTLDTIVDDLEGLRRALGLSRVAVLGHSHHSILAVAYAARYPERVARVIVVGGAPAESPALRERAAQYWEVAASPARKRLLAENQARLTDELLARLTPSERMYVPYAANGPRFFYDPAYNCTPLWAGHDNLSPELFAHFWGPSGQFATFAPHAVFPQVAAPVFIAHGVFYFGDTPVAWAGLKELLPNHTYRAFERSGHYPHIEERAEFDAALLAWLGDGAD